MRICSLIILFLFYLISSVVAVESQMQKSPADSLLISVDSNSYIKSNIFYDNLVEKSKKSDLKGLLFKSIFVNNNWKNPESASGQLIEEIDYYKQFEGKRIRNVLIFRSNIINMNDSTRNPVERWHVLTKQFVIRRNLFFKEGGSIDAAEIVRNQQFLRSLRFLSDAYILIQPLDKDQVDVIVYTRDNLSLAPGFSSLGSERYYTFSAESNIFGTGNKFEVGMIASPISPQYRGYKSEYQFQNIGSSFFNLNLFAYKELSDENYRASASKSYLLPSDYAGGVVYEMIKSHPYQHINDSVVALSTNDFELWAGKSFELKPKFGSLFANVAWRDCRFDSPFNLPSSLQANYSNFQRLLWSVGLYRENFYHGSLIYGFGRNEDIPFGYKIEAIGGHTWDALGKRWYIGGKMQYANITRFGYANSKIEFGTFFNSETKAYQQSVLSVESSYFTKLIPIGNWALRNFFVGKYSHGFNRLSGEGERLYLSSATSPRAIDEYKSGGLNRFLLSVESVGFSPFYLYNFRFAFYGFADWAWLGDYSNVFKNNQFTSVGIGVRIKNERLIFQTIQLRIGFAVKNPTNASTNWFDLSEEARMRSDRLIPGKADVVEYR
ncbi:MAG: hypothetical protein ACOYOT_08790 [Bacteroidales bacterium]